MTRGSATHQLDAETGFLQLGFDQVPFIPLDLDHSLLDTASGAALFLEQGGQGFLLIGGYAMNGDHPGTLAPLGLAANAHGAVGGEGGGGLGSALLLDHAAICAVNEAAVVVVTHGNTLWVS
ncbi:hypothetical protein AERO8C_20134 [Aeromonas veronii]|uniref:Uncharacterized protein n=1 Tax=Aeromonas veronii TaxID=654 RepID=A0A653L0I4_AERVE|nr:hypothetical protein AERO8C_20134 [Aeromonas veronii]